MDVREVVKTGHLTKLFDGSKLSEEQVQSLLELIRSAPSSVNTQPGHYVVASSPASKARIAKSMMNGYEANLQKLDSASHIIVFCSRMTMSDEHARDLIAQQHADGKFKDAEDEDAWTGVLRFGIRLHTFERKNLGAWFEKQVYLAMGVALMGAADLGIDVCPLEGFHPLVLDEELDLQVKGYTSILLLAAGRRSPHDYAIGSPKSRLPLERIVTYLD
jgi:nitroreductase/dihydropteridine reductase